MSLFISGQEWHKGHSECCYFYTGTGNMYFRKEMVIHPIVMYEKYIQNSISAVFCSIVDEPIR